MEMLVKTFAGLEPLLAQELRELGAEDVEPIKRAVICQGDHELLYKANLWLRTGLRILVPIQFFDVEHEEALYNILMQVQWDDYMQLGQTFAVDAVTQSKQLHHSHFLALKTKDAIVDWFREHNRGKRPNVNIKQPDIRFHLHIDSQNRATLLRDASGDGLHRRGYRTDGGAAPLNEVLAAGMVLLSGWNREEPFVDMMCGSGTLVIEAGLLATNTPPGQNRSFAFENWPDFKANVWEGVKMDARAVQQTHDIPIIGIDKNFKAIRIAENNVEAAGLSETVRVRRSAFQKYLPPLGPGTLISNPPYGLRIEDDNIVNLYGEIGDKLKKDFTGYRAWVLSGNMEALKNVGLRPSRRIHLLNGQLECKFHLFELYSGSKKASKQDK